jgi:hypothetical protein
MVRSRLALAASASVVVVLACGGRTGGGPVDGGGDGSSSGGAMTSSSGVTSSSGAGSGGVSSGGSSGGLHSDLGLVLHNQAIDKVDLLFMIDNSASMGDKQALLAQAIPDMIARLVTPNCVDPTGNVLGRSDMNGQCSAGRPEYPAVHDMHIGIVTSSLGGRGGNQCPPDAMNEANHNLNAHNDDQGRLINRGGDSEAPVPNAGSPTQNFLAWYPSVLANKNSNSNPPPPVPPETAVGSPGMAGTLIGDFTSMIQGVHEHGCGFEAQNEAWYRFLVQPDPFDHIQIVDNQAKLVGVDAVILQQRKAFLRPDSLLAVIVVTDENEEVVNPLSITGEGWLYESAPFPSSPSYGAPEGTVECTAAPGPMSGPNDPNCTSCAFMNVQMASNFASRCPNDGAKGVQGFLDPNNDSVNVRFFHQKQRFGVFPGYPVTRYTRGLMSPTVPDGTHEVDGNGNYVGDQDQYANCVNPVFAQNLPTDPNADLCHLQRGPRTPDLVFYAAIAGVPHQLLQSQPGDRECSAATAAADCPPKSVLIDSDWLAITGKDPEHYDFSGVDFHMLESETPRGPAPCGPNSADNCDLINGREWNTTKKDLQFACIFPLTDPATGTPVARDCTDPKYTGACDCATGSNSQNTPLCQKNGGAYTNTQIFGKAYPSVREMLIAHTLATSPSGIQGVAASLCPIHTSFAGGPTDPLYGYRPAVNAIVDRLRISLIVQCLPQKLTVDPKTGSAPCHILVTLPNPGAEDVCAMIAGLSAPDPTLLRRFRAGQEAGWNPASGLPDPSTLPVCELRQLTPQTSPVSSFGPDGTCSDSPTSGWCYVEGQAAGACPQQIIFTSGEPPPRATANVLCQ